VKRGQGARRGTFIVLLRIVSALVLVGVLGWQPIPASADASFDLTATVGDGAVPIIASQRGKSSGGKWTVVVHNIGSSASSGTTFVNIGNGGHGTGGPLSASGEGWTCETVGYLPAIQCTNDIPVPAGGSLPPLVAPVEAFDGYGYLYGEVAVSNQDDSNTRNNTIRIGSSVKMSPVDLTANVTDGDAPFVSSPDGQRPGGEWKIVVHNVGTEASSGTTSVNVNNGRIFTGGPLSASGEGWACEAQGIAIICSNDTPVPPRGSLPPLMVAVGAFMNYGLLNGEIYVFNPGDGNGWNNTVGLLTPVALGGSVDLTINIEDSDQLGETAGELRYRLVVENVGGAATTDPISVSFPNPGGAASASGSGWDCDQSRPQSRYGGNYGGVCTTSQVVEAGGRLPPIEVTATLPRHNRWTVMAEAEVDQSEDAAASGNNYVRLTTPVRPSPVDLVVNLTDGSSPFVANEAAEYKLTVRNVGSAASSGDIRVSYPEFTNGMSASGSGWVCQAKSGTEYGGTCTTSRRAAPGTSLPPITASAPVSAGVVGSTYRGNAAVENALDGNSGNDAAFVETPIAATGPTTSDIAYVAMGDSFSAGEGTGSYLPGTDDPARFNSCHRSNLAYGPLLRQGANLGRMLFVACSGAVTDDLFLQNKDNPTERAQLEELRKVGATTKVVTLTIGGNDIGFPRALPRCVEGLSSQTIRSILPDWIDDRIPSWNHGWGCSKDKAFTGAIAKRLSYLDGAKQPTLQVGPPVHPIAEVLQEIHKRAPQATIYIAGYPELFGTDLASVNQGQRRVCVVGRLAGIAPFSVDSRDAAWLNEQANKLNSVIKRQVAIAKGADKQLSVRYVSPGLFASHGLCSGSAWINRITFTESIPGDILSSYPDPASFHPKAVGQRNGYARAFLKRMPQP
jgi:lysophospholipase L1-like esterase